MRVRHLSRGTDEPDEPGSGTDTRTHSNRPCLRNHGGDWHDVGTGDKTRDGSEIRRGSPHRPRSGPPAGGGEGDCSTGRRTPHQTYAARGRILGLPAHGASSASRAPERRRACRRVDPVAATRGAAGRVRRPGSQVERHVPCTPRPCPGPPTGTPRSRPRGRSTGLHAAQPVRAPSTAPRADRPRRTGRTPTRVPVPAGGRQADPPVTASSRAGDLKEVREETATTVS